MRAINFNNSSNFEYLIDSLQRVEDYENLANLASQISKINKNENKVLHYWESYALFKMAISTIETDKELAEKNANKSIAVLESIDYKDSEDYALLALVINFSINFSSMLTKPIKSRKVINLAKKSLELDSNNPRAYVALGINNFFTPEIFGGKSKTEEYLLKALKYIPKQNLVGKPSWGKLRILYYLVRYYIDCEKFDEAMKYSELGVKQFPKYEVFPKLIKYINAR